MGGVPEPHTGWTFLTNHARVLAAIADDQTARIRDIAAHCRLTERAVQKIISDLEESGFLSHTREGRGNTYRIEPGKILRHPAEAEAGLTVASLLGLLAQDEAHRTDGLRDDGVRTARGHGADAD
ncbi:MarR family transcriptional regulator [Streptomyces sp. SID8379]|uniref:helix-turn-helix transcriptional regulator n=1 Tax=unclassified Streptomyces TaxID=2593676 RepID=UPI0006866B01|nr:MULTISPECIES: helix-turn-helix domain-containing protein [unclassified Streptomyces]MYW63155.1 MarR family transcriptional regulator [Streptomyces sp. SID8379]